MSHFNPWRLASGVAIPNWLAERTEVSAQSKIIYASIMHESDPDGEWLGAYASTAMRIGCSAHDVMVGCDELAEHGLLEKGRHWYFLEHPWMGLQATKRDEALFVDEPPAAPSPAAHRATDFDRFWESYPRKIGKAAAAKAWKRAHRPPLQQILDALEAQKRSQNWLREGGQYIPHPSTWINQGRWDDVIEDGQSHTEEDPIWGNLLNPSVKPA